MAARTRTRSVTTVSEARVDFVYAAALGAAADPATAEDATARVFAAAALRRSDGDVLAATAIRLALRAAPAEPFAAMDGPDAEAVALARLLRADERRIATLLGVDRVEVRRRLRRGLCAITPRVAACA